MFDIATFSLFLAAAFLLAITPGPGLLYVLTRSIKGGREEGVTSALGTAVGGFGHVIAAALGLSTILAASAVAFNVVKYAGAAYLIYLGVRTLLSRDDLTINVSALPSGSRNAFYQGIITEILNPKTALFFLAFIPQFINPDRVIFLQFLLLGSIVVLCNTSIDLIVALLAGPIGHWLRSSLRFRQGQRLFSGCALIGLGTYVAVGNDQH